MPDTAGDRSDGRTAPLEIPPDMIEFHVTRARRLRAGAFGQAIRRLRSLFGRRRLPPVELTPIVVARPRPDIDRLAETLRQPLTSIRSLSELLQENPDLTPEEQAKMLGLIVEETKRLNRLIGQCLDLVAEAGIANDRYSDRDRRGAA